MFLTVRRSTQGRPHRLSNPPGGRSRSKSPWGHPCTSWFPLQLRRSHFRPPLLRLRYRTHPPLPKYPPQRHWNRRGRSCRLSTPALPRSRPLSHLRRTTSRLSCFQLYLEVTPRRNKRTRQRWPEKWREIGRDGARGVADVAWPRRVRKSAA